MSVRTRSLRATLAVLLLLVQALLPGLHRWQHVLADADAHIGHPCACEHADADAGKVVARAGHAHPDHACGVCALLALGRHALPGPGPVLAMGTAPRCEAPPSSVAACPQEARAPCPPARGPPLS